MSVDPRMDLIAARIEKLEAQNRRFKQAGLALLLLGALLLLLAIPYLRSTPPMSERNLETNNVTLRDSVGRKRVEITVEPPVISFYDENGALAVSLGTPIANQPSLNLLGAGGTASLFDGPDGAALDLSGRDKSSATIDSFAIGGSVAVADGNGNASILGVATVKNPIASKTPNTSAASLTMWDKKNQVIWSAP
jgi:hypothetical protein